MSDYLEMSHFARKSVGVQATFCEPVVIMKRDYNQKFYVDEIDRLSLLNTRLRIDNELLRSQPVMPVSRSPDAKILWLICGLLVFFLLVSFAFNMYFYVTK